MRFLLLFIPLFAFAGDAIVSSATSSATEQCDGSTGNATIVCRWIDPSTGSDSNAGTEVSPWLTIGKAQTYVETDVGNTTIMLEPGSYPEFVWELSAGLEHTTTWKSASTPARFDGMTISCSTLCVGNQIFDGINFYLAAQPSLETTNVDIQDMAHVEIKNSEIHNDSLYQSEGLRIRRSYHVTIRNTEVHDVVHAIRYSGDNHNFIGLNIHTVPGSLLSMTTCNVTTGTRYSARYILIEDNWLHDKQSDYPLEPFYEFYDEPAELHSSVISIRGRDVIIKDNWMHHYDGEPVIQLYAGEAGCENPEIANGYDIQNITITGNVGYEMNRSGFIQASDSPNGRIILENNTIIGSGLGVRLDKIGAEGYLGAGSRAVNNLVINGGFSGITAVNYALTENIEAVVTNNFSQFPSFPARDYYIASGNWYAQGFDLTNKFITAMNHIPIQVLVPDGAPDYTLDYADTSIFVDPDYSTTSATDSCAPRGTDSCDWTPQPESVICTLGTGGGHVGAIACD